MCAILSVVCVCVFGLSGVHVCSVCVCGVFGNCVRECVCLCLRVCVSVCMHVRVSRRNKGR